MIRKLSRLYLPLALACTGLIYLLAADGPYLIDDIPNLVDNEHLILERLDYDSLKQAALSSPSSRFYRPLSMLSFAANYTLSGNKSAWSVKATNIVLHLLIGLGVFLLSRMLLTRLLPARIAGDDNLILLTSSLAAAMWLAHPLFVSTVLYAVQRMAMLSAFFVIYGCVLYLRLRTRTVRENRGYVTLLLSIPAVTAAGFLAKENAFLLPGFLLLIELYCFGFRRHGHAPVWFKPGLAIFLLAPVVFVFLYLVYTYLAFDTGGPVPGYAFTLKERILTQFRVLWHYLGWLTFLNPEPLGIYHDDIAVSKSLLAPVTTLISLLAWPLLVFAAFSLNRRAKLYSFALLWFLWGHSLESTSLPLAMSFEHRNYLPGMGPILALAGLMGSFLHKHADRTAVTALLLLALFLLPHGLLYERSQRWSSHQSLALWMLERHPHSVHGLALSANYLASTGDTQHALAALERAWQLAPGNSAVLFNALRIHCQTRPSQRFGEDLQDRMKTVAVDGMTANSRRYYNRVADACPASTVNHDLLLQLYRRFSRSADTGTRALSYYGMGNIHVRNNDYRQALKAWQEAVSYNPQAKTLRKRIRQLRQLPGTSATQD